MDTMLFTGLPVCSPGHKHVLVIEESPDLIVIVLHDKEKDTRDSAKYFLPLPETHILVKSILESGGGLRVQKIDLRKNYGVTLCEFRTISPH